MCYSCRADYNAARNQSHSARRRLFEGFPLLFSGQLIAQVVGKRQLVQRAMALDEVGRAQYPAFSPKQAEYAADFPFQPLIVLKAQRRLARTGGP